MQTFLIVIAMLAVAVLTGVSLRLHRQNRALVADRDYWKDVVGSSIDARIIDAWTSGKIHISRAYQFSDETGKDHTFYVMLDGEQITDVRNLPLRQAFQAATRRSERRIEKLYEEASKLSTITM